MLHNESDNLPAQWVCSVPISSCDRKWKSAFRGGRGGTGHLIIKMEGVWLHQPPHHLPLPPHTALMWLVSVLMLLNEPSAGGGRLRLGSIRYYTFRDYLSLTLCSPSAAPLFWGLLGISWQRVGMLPMGGGVVADWTWFQLGQTGSASHQISDRKTPAFRIYVTDTKSQESLIPCQITISEVEDFFFH